MNNTTCTYYKRSVTRYKCEPTYNEEEVISWIDPEPGGGFYEYEEEEQEFANQEIIDSLHGYPCAKEVLQQLPSINSEVENILQNVFGVNEDINIKFSVSTTLDPNTEGETICGGSPNYFNCTVLLNANMLNEAAKDYMVSTFIHEALHAYIGHQKTILDSNTFKIKFPIFAKYIGFDAQHQEMAENYLNLMINTIRSFNPTISEYNAKALAWVGLNMTTAWDRVPDLEKAALIQISNAGRNPTTSDFTTYSFKKCP